MIGLRERVRKSAFRAGYSNPVVCRDRSYTKYLLRLIPFLSPSHIIDSSTELFLVELHRETTGYSIWRGGPKSRRFVSKRIAFFGNTRCLSNIRELAPAHWIGHSDGVKYSFQLHENLKEFRPQKNQIAKQKMFGIGEFLS